MVSMTRRADVNRKTNETAIELVFGLDGSGTSAIDTGIGFFDHMLDLFTKHGNFDLSLKVDGDLRVDFHHSVEDVGICLGQAFRDALGDASGISRYSSGLIPMDEALCQMAIDVSNRPFLDFQGAFPKSKVGEFDVELVKEFFNAFVSNARVTLHLEVIKGENLHHMIEACFKAFGQLLDKATRIDPMREGVPSTKGVL